MSRITPPLALTIVLAGMSAPEAALAESLKKASQKDIAMLLDAATGTNSAYQASLIGETKDRVYIEYVTGTHVGSLFSNRPRRIVYWVPGREISSEQLTLFKTYKEKRQAPRN